jgi:hypothetical protein
LNESFPSVRKFCCGTGIAKTFPAYPLCNPLTCSKASRLICSSSHRARNAIIKARRIERRSASRAPVMAVPQAQARRDQPCAAPSTSPCRALNCALTRSEAVCAIERSSIAASRSSNARVSGSSDSLTWICSRAGDDAAMWLVSNFPETNTPAHRRRRTPPRTAPARCIAPNRGCWIPCRDRP